MKQPVESSLPRPPHRIVITNNAQPPRLSLNLVFHEIDPFEHVGRHWALDSIIERARPLVGQYSLERNRGFVMLAEWCVQQDVTRAGLPPEKCTARNPLTDPLPSILADRIDAFAINETEDFATTTWPEIFAALALAYVARSLRAHGEGRTAYADDQAATDAISIAERLQRAAEDKRARKRRNGRKGGKTRGQNRYAPLREAAVALACTGRYPSYKTAAAAFCTSDYDWEGAGLEGPPSDETVARWLGRDPRSRKAIKGKP